MKKLIIAAFIASFFLTISALAQVKPSLVANNHPSTMKAGNTSSLPVSVALTQTYRVGVGDVLDIQLPASLSSKSTLHTVLENGLLDYPLARAPLPVGGLTTEVIAARLRTSIKVLDNPLVSVKVRDYASHAVNVIGFVSVPGVKLLRREAVPLYAVLSEAMPMPDATSATLIRAGRSAEVVDLRDTSALSQLVVAGDLIKVSVSPIEPTDFFFAGREINSPGQNPYHPELTLTQAILASGGPSSTSGNQIRVS